MRLTRHGMYALAFAYAFAARADFSWELSGVVGEMEREDTESDLMALSGTYFFDTVADGNGPMALATFLDPTSNVFISASEEELSADIGTGLELGPERTDYTIGGTYVFDSKWYAGGRYSSPELETPAPPAPPSPATSTILSADSDEDGYGVFAGKYIGAGATRLELSLERREVDTDLSIRTCVFTTLCLDSRAQAETTVDEQRFEVKHVGQVRSATYALHGGIGRTDTDLNAHVSVMLPGQPPLFQNDAPGPDVNADSYMVGAELYPVPRVGVQIGHTVESAEDPVDAEQEAVNVGVSWFFHRNVALELALSRIDADTLPRAERAALRVFGRL